MSRESNDAFDAFAARKGYKPGTWNYIRTAEAWQAALAWAAANVADLDCAHRCGVGGEVAAKLTDASGVPELSQPGQHTHADPRLERAQRASDAKFSSATHGVTVARDQTVTPADADGSPNP